jgi:hypothetical protein
MLQAPVPDDRRLFGVRLTAAQVRVIDALIEQSCHDRRSEKRSKRSAIIRESVVRGLQSLIDERASEVRL